MIAGGKFVYISGTTFSFQHHLSWGAEAPSPPSLESPPAFVLAADVAVVFSLLYRSLTLAPFSSSSLACLCLSSSSPYWADLSPLGLLQCRLPSHLNARCLEG